MKASELIVKLKELKEAYGDLEIKRWDRDSYYEDSLLDVEVVTISCEAGGYDYIEIL